MFTKLLKVILKKIRAINKLKYEKIYHRNITKIYRYFICKQ